MFDLPVTSWLLLLLGGFAVGVSKSGLAGVSLVQVLVFAVVFGAKQSTGVLLPLLVVGDCCAVWLVGRDVVWAYVFKLLPPALVGVVIGWLLLGRLEDAVFRPCIGGLVLALCGGQLLRMWRGDLLARVPHTRGFASATGVLSGVATMLANAAGPIVALYLLAVALPKHRLVATGAWFFLILNLSKVPFSASLGLMSPKSLAIDAILAPCVVAGLITGRAVVRKIPQKAFDTLLLLFTAVAALRLLIS
ncbi:MAG: sulfite exporter TauE/SafE family protein [Pirellulales bacterium]